MPWDGGPSMAGSYQITTPYYFTLEAYGGLEQRAAPLSTSRYERDGVWRATIEPTSPPTPTIVPAERHRPRRRCGGRGPPGSRGSTDAPPTAASTTPVTSPPRNLRTARTPVSYDGTRISRGARGLRRRRRAAHAWRREGRFQLRPLREDDGENIFASFDWYTSRRSPSASTTTTSVPRSTRTRSGTSSWRCR